jgi:hypothetical protein
MMVPSNKLNPMLRFGFFTSPAINEILCHESQENNVPFIAIAIEPKAARPINGILFIVASSLINVDNLQASFQLAFHILMSAPHRKPKKINVNNDKIFTMVRVV